MNTNFCCFSVCVCVFSLCLPGFRLTDLLEEWEKYVNTEIPPQEMIDRPTPLSEATPSHRVMDTPPGPSTSHQDVDTPKEPSTSYHTITPPISGPHAHTLSDHLPNTPTHQPAFSMSLHCNSTMTFSYCICLNVLHLLKPTLIDSPSDAARDSMHSRWRRSQSEPPRH